MARFKWYSVEDQSKFDDTMKELTTDMKEYLASIKGEEDAATNDGAPKSPCKYEYLASIKGEEDAATNDGAPKSPCKYEYSCSHH